MGAVEFDLLFEPKTVTSQQKGVNYQSRRHYTKPEVVKAKKELAFLLRPYVPPEPFDCPVALHTVWRFKRGKTKKDGEYRATKPDTDNIQKLLKDTMEDLGFWKDDSRVVDDRCEKIWSDEPGIFVRIMPLPKIREEKEYGTD